MVVETFSGKPYDEFVLEGETIRVFREETPEEDLVWHRDKEDRIITVLENNGWLFQYDDTKPKVLVVGEEYFIRKMEYHRLLKGKGKLIIKIKKL